MGMKELLLWQMAVGKAMRLARKRRDWAGENFFSMWYWDIEGQVEALR
jgi:hypothetical protein